MRRCKVDRLKSETSGWTNYPNGQISPPRRPFRPQQGARARPWVRQDRADGSQWEALR